MENSVVTGNSGEPRPEILLIDDDEKMLRALVVMLGARYTVVGVGDTRRALELLRARAFDVVVSDYEIGDGNGLDILNCVNQTHPDTPVIIITAFGTKEMVIKTINHRVFGFLEKPFEPHDVEALIEQALDKRHREEVVHKFANLGEAAGQIVHDIASPLTVLYAKLDELKDVAFAHGDKQLLASAHTMAQCAQRIYSIIKWTKNDLQKSKTPQEAFGLREVLDTLKEECLANALAQAVPVVITPGSDVSVTGSKQQLTEVLINLVNNAIEAAAVQSEKWVTVDAKIESGNLVIKVTDSGKGIPEEVRGKLFTPLFTTKRGSGTGLGLVIAQRIVKAHGGDLVFNEKCGNTQFIVRIPAAA